MESSADADYRRRKRVTLPRISVVTPSYQQANYLRQTLESIHAQNYPNLEHIVIDGGSTDGSIEILKAYDSQLAYWVSEPDAGQSDAINKGFAHATGEIMTWLNSDDVLLDGALQTVGEIFQAFPQVAWLTGQPANMDVAGNLKQFPLKTGRFQKFIQRGWYHGRGLGFIRQEGTFWRRSLWEQVDSHINTAKHYAMDFDLWQRFAQHAPLYTVDQTLAAFRTQPEQKTSHIDRYYTEADITTPSFMRYPMLPLRALFTWGSWPFAPRIIRNQANWQVQN